VDGVYGHGPVTDLAADGDRVAFTSCDRVWLWTPSTGTTQQIDGRASGSSCLGPWVGIHDFGLGLAGDRVVWSERVGGNSVSRTTFESSAASPLRLGSSLAPGGFVPMSGLGTPVGSGGLLVASAWKIHYSADNLVTDSQTIERIEPGGCPCPALSSSPGPYTPLDVNEGRIVVSGSNQTRVLAADGSILLSLPVPVQVAQLDGPRLVLALPRALRVYDSESGALLHESPIPADTIGRPCDSYGDPQCTTDPPQCVLTDAAHALALFICADAIHVLQLADGTDTTVAHAFAQYSIGALARFTNAGLVYADQARIRFTPFDRLPAGAG
jgi:hypothetical protein